MKVLEIVLAATITIIGITATTAARLTLVKTCATTTSITITTRLSTAKPTKEVMMATVVGAEVAIETTIIEITNITLVAATKATQVIAESIAARTIKDMAIEAGGILRALETDTTITTIIRSKHGTSTSHTTTTPISILEAAVTTMARVEVDATYITRTVIKVKTGISHKLQVEA